MKGEALAPKLAGRGTTMTENPLAVGRSVDQEATNDAIATMLDPPSKDAWDPIRESYISLVQQVDALSKEVSALKRQDIASSMLSPDSPRTASMALLDSVRGPAAIRARTMRKTFKPTSGGASEGVLDAGQDSKV